MDVDARNRIPVDYSRTNAQVFVSIVKLALEMPDAALRLPKLWEDFAWVPSMTRGVRTSATKPMLALAGSLVSHYPSLYWMLSLPLLSCRLRRTRV
jgi:hypothetical protein